MKTLKKFLFLLANFNLFLGQAFAQGRPGGGGTPGEYPINPATQYKTIEDLLHGIVGWIVKIGAPIATIMILVGAYQILFSAGDPEKVKTGRNTILYTAIAYGIILIGWGITTVIKEILGVK